MTLLKENTVQVFFIQPEKIIGAKLLESFKILLSAEEHIRHDRFRFAKDRHQYLITRTLIRSQLSKFSNIPAKELLFKQNRWGRPELKPQQTTIPIRFNLTHTHNFIACAITLIHDIGIDVENLSRSADIIKLSDRIFSTAENNYLSSLEKDEMHIMSTRQWTLKEAYIKARGQGLSLALLDFSILPDNSSGEMKLHCNSSFDSDKNNWYFSVLEPINNYITTLAIRQKRKSKIQLKISEWSPDQSIINS